MGSPGFSNKLTRSNLFVNPLFISPLCQHLFCQHLSCQLRVSTPCLIPSKGHGLLPYGFGTPWPQICKRFLESAAICEVLIVAMVWLVKKHGTGAQPIGDLPGQYGYASKSMGPTQALVRLVRLDFRSRPHRLWVAFASKRHLHLGLDGFNRLDRSRIQPPSCAFGFLESNTSPHPPPPTPPSPPANPRPTLPPTPRSSL